MKRTILPALLAVALLAGCGSATGVGSPIASSTAPDGATTAPAVDESTEPAAPTETPLKASDIVIRVKVKDKKCFGSAGCNVTYALVLSWKNEHPLDSDYDVTVAVKGIEDGPAIQTVTVTQDGQYSGGEEFGSTPNSKTVLSAKVTEISPA